MIIAFTGPDGAGKTTQARLLQRYLHAKGQRISYVRLRSHHLIAYLVLMIFRCTGIVSDISSPRITDYRIREIAGRKSLRYILILIETFSALIWLFVNVKLKEKVGYTIIAERYVIDFLVSLQVSLSFLNDRRLCMIILKIMSRFVNKSINIYLYGDNDELLKRKKNELLSHIYLSYLKVMYLLFLRLLNTDFVSINTTKRSIVLTFKELITTVTNNACFKDRSYV